MAIATIFFFSVQLQISMLKVHKNYTLDTRILNMCTCICYIRIFNIYQRSNPVVQDDFQITTSACAVMRIVGHGTLRTAIFIRLASQNMRANALIAIVSRVDERSFRKRYISRAKRKEKKNVLNCACNLTLTSVLMPEIHLFIRGVIALY